MKKSRLLIATLFLGMAASAFAGAATEAKSPVKPEEKNSLDLFSAEETYTLRSDFRDHRFGSGDSLYGDYSLDHRFPVTGNWYFRLGAEYERFDFGGSNNGLP